MEMYVVSGIVIVCTFIASYVGYRITAHVHTFEDSAFSALSKMQEEITKQTPPDPERLIALERRQEQLEGDVLRHLRKISQRERRANKAEFEEEATPEAREAFEESLLSSAGDNGTPVSDSEDTQLDYVRSLINRR